VIPTVGVGVGVGPVAVGSQCRRNLDPSKPPRDGTKTPAFSHRPPDAIPHPNTAFPNTVATKTHLSHLYRRSPHRNPVRIGPCVPADVNRDSNACPNEQRDSSIGSVSDHSIVSICYRRHRNAIGWWRIAILSRGSDAVERLLVFVVLVWKKWVWSFGVDVPTSDRKDSSEVGGGGVGVATVEDVFGFVVALASDRLLSMAYQLCDDAF